MVKGNVAKQKENDVADLNEVKSNLKHLEQKIGAMPIIDFTDEKSLGDWGCVECEMDEVVLGAEIWVGGFLTDTPDDLGGNGICVNYRQIERREEGYYYYLAQYFFEGGMGEYVYIIGGPVYSGSSPSETIKGERGIFYRQKKGEAKIGEIASINMLGTKWKKFATTEDLSSIEDSIEFKIGLIEDRIDKINEKYKGDLDESIPIEYFHGANNYLVTKEIDILRVSESAKNKPTNIGGGICFVIVRDATDEEQEREGLLVSRIYSYIVTQIFLSDSGAMHKRIYKFRMDGNVTEWSQWERIDVSRTEFGTKVAALETSVGDIEIALDNIIAIQNELIGGESV